MQTAYGASSKVCSNSSGHMTKMTVYGKKHLKYSSPEPFGRWHWNVVCSIGDVGPTKFIQTMIKRLNLAYLTLRSNWLPVAFKWEHILTS